MLTTAIWPTNPECQSLVTVKSAATDWAGADEAERTATQMSPSQKREDGTPDSAANVYLTREYRKGYELPVV